MRGWVARAGRHVQCIDANAGRFGRWQAAVAD
jgi:hypothetical protein